MRIVREQGVERFVRLVGRMDDPRTLLSAFDVGLLASRSEAFPNFVLEAMAGALPVVVTDVGDCRTLVGDSGAVCVPGDVAGLTDALNQLVNDEAERAARGRRAQERAVSQYSLDKVTATYANYYRKILAL